MGLTSDAPRIVTLRDADLDDALALQSVAGWNQTAADWSRILRLDPDGSFGARIGGRLVGTTTTLTFGTVLAWIGMVLVAPALRGRGIGRLLMEHALAHLRSAGVTTIKLDATPAGKPLYEKLGFETELLLERWERSPKSIGYSVHELQEPPLPEAALELDRAAFGLDRSDLLRALETDSIVPPITVSDARDTLSGFALARDGMLASYVGPVVARDRVGAAALLDRVSRRLGQKRIFIDVNTTSRIHGSLLADHGFSKQRELFRMWSGVPTVHGTSPMIIAIAGPELG